jgi:hypothetical protein
MPLLILGQSFIRYAPQLSAHLMVYFPFSLPTKQTIFHPHLSERFLQLRHSSTNSWQCQCFAQLASPLQDVKDEALKTSLGPKHKLRSEHRGNDETSNFQDTDPESQSIRDEEGTHELNQGAQVGEDYPQLLRTYLYRRRPGFLRQRLDQYYYQDLMNSTPRDGDQVVMRQFSEDKKRLRLQADRKYIQLSELKKELEDDE